MGATAAATLPSRVLGRGRSRRRVIDRGTVVHRERAGRSFAQNPAGARGVHGRRQRREQPIGHRCTGEQHAYRSHTGQGNAKQPVGTRRCRHMYEQIRKR